MSTAKSFLVVSIALVSMLSAGQNSVAVEACGKSFVIGKKAPSFDASWNKKGLYHIKTSNDGFLCKVVVTDEGNVYKVEKTKKSKFSKNDISKIFDPKLERSFYTIVTQDGEEISPETKKDFFSSVMSMKKRPKVLKMFESGGGVDHEAIAVCYNGGTSCLYADVFYVHENPDFEMKNKTFLDQMKKEIKPAKEILRDKTRKKLGLPPEEEQFKTTEE